MAKTIYVAKSGNNSNDGSESKPVLTIGKAIGLSASGDTIIVGDGTYTNENNNGDQNSGLAPKNGTTLRAKNKRKAIIDQTNTIKYGFFIGGRKNIVVDGFEIKNASVVGINCGGNPCVMLKLVNNHVHHCKNNGIATNGGDLLLIDGNEVNHCANAGAQSGISVWHSIEQAGDTPEDGYRIRVTNNNVHHCRPDGGSTSDGNGIIIDQLYQNGIDPKYNGKVLVAGNTCWRNRGSGIRMMASKNVTVEYNTCWDNGQNVTPDVQDGWCGEIHNQWAKGNIIRYNIGAAGRAPSGGWGNNGNSNESYVATQPGDGNTIHDNIFWGFDGDGSGKYVAGKAQNVTPSSYQKASPDTNLIDVDPMLKDPANGDFSTKPDSPARGAAKDGKDIGAWQSGDGPPDPEPEPEPEPDGELEERVDDLETRMQALESWAGSFNK